MRVTSTFEHVTLDQNLKQPAMSIFDSAFRTYNSKGSEDNLKTKTLMRNASHKSGLISEHASKQNLSNESNHNTDLLAEMLKKEQNI